MSSLLEELQRESYESRVDITTLLRKAYIVARKLKINEFQRWIDNELNGYNLDDEIPEYRDIGGVVKAYDLRSSWVPAIFDNYLLYNQLNHRRSGQLITELVSLLDCKDELSFTFPKVCRDRTFKIW